jgi:hypothetical protein
MGDLHRPILELRHGTHLKHGFLLEAAARVVQRFSVVYIFDYNRIQDSTTDFSHQNHGQITQQISRFKATDSRRFILLFRTFAN